MSIDDSTAPISDDNSVEAILTRIGLRKQCIACQQWFRASHKARKYCSKFCGRKSKEARKGFAYSSMQWRYGITPNQVCEMERLQNFRCDICRTPFTLLRRTVDHDHATGKVRGLLCGRCNSGLGYFLDNPKILRRAIAYLEKHKT